MLLVLDFGCSIVVALRGRGAGYCGAFGGQTCYLQYLFLYVRDR